MEYKHMLEDKSIDKNTLNKAMEVLSVLPIKPQKVSIYNKIVYISYGRTERPNIFEIRIDDSSICMYSHGCTIGKKYSELIFNLFKHYKGSRE